MAGTGQYSRLAASLRTERPPTLASVLAPGDVFAAITIGCDLGYHDSLLVVAHGDHRESWTVIIEEFRHRVTVYESMVDSIASFDAFAAAIDTLQRPINRQE